MNHIGVRRFAAGAGLLAIAIASASSSALSDPQQPLPAPLHGVVSRVSLSPLLLSAARRVRFSPDGAFILVQDDAGILVFTRRPLGLLLFVNAPRVLPARFSSDSKYLIIATPSLTIARYDLEFPQQAPLGPMLVPKGCLSAAISADGEVAACYDPDYHLHVVRTAGGEELFSEAFGSAPAGGTPVSVPRGTESAFAEPFGYFSAASMHAWIGRRDFGLHMAFSADGRYLMARDLRGEVIAVDVRARKKLAVPSSFRRHVANAWCFAGPDQIVSLDPRKKGGSALLTFPRGENRRPLQTAGTEVEWLSDPRYLRVEPPDDGAPLVFDLSANAHVETLPPGASDIFGGYAATYSVDGDMLLTKMGDAQPLERFTLPFNPLPTLRTAVVSPNLQSLAIAGRDVGEVYDVATGKRVAHFPRMNGAWFAGEEFVYLRSRLPDGSVGPVQRLEIASGKLARAWSETSSFEALDSDVDIHPAGPVLLVDSPLGVKLASAHLGESGPGARALPRSGTVGIQLQTTSAFVLSAFSTQKGGSPLWSRHFKSDVPVPFADPQGDRYLLAWAATSESGRNEVKAVSSLPGHEKPSQLSEHDTVFEVFDVRTGKFLGGAVVRIGAGPENFESAFSVGDSLILVKDDQRITILSLSTGRPTARLFGTAPSASAAAGLLAAADGPRLTLFELATGAKRGEFAFPDPVAYTHFSSDGRRLLVLTSRQLLLVLDVSGSSVRPATGGGLH